MPVMAEHPGQPVPAGGPTRLSLMTGWQARRVGDVGRWLVTVAGFLRVGWALRDVFKRCGTRAAVAAWRAR